MNEKCSLDNLSRYLRVIGLLSLIIILIIVVYYYLQSNRSKILEKYESYALRECKVYFTEGDTNIKNCDITQETSNYTGTCSYRFDGWNEFDTYTDNDGKTITYPKKVYTQTRTNTNDFNNPMFTNNCFKAYTDETCLSNTPNDNCIPPEFEYNANNVVRYDEPGTSGNTAVGTNIYGGLRYSSMQFLNTADARYNNTNLISSICDVAPNDALGSLKDKVFYMFEFNGTTNKLENIRSVALDSNQTTFSPVSSDNVLTNLPPRTTDASFYGIQYDATNRNLPIKIFKKNNIPRNVAVFKFNYMSYICTNSQIKNYMRANRIIIPEKFIKYGSSTTPNYSKNISIGNMTIKKDWKWSDYSSADFNVDYSDMLKTDLNTSIEERKRAIKLSYKEREDIAEQEYDTAKEVFDAASQSRKDFATNNSTFSSLIGKRNATSTASIFDYKKGYNTSSIDNLNFSIPQGANVSKVGTDFIITFLYNANNNAQTQYMIDIRGKFIADILIVGGGGAGANFGGGGGAGQVLYTTNLTINTGTAISIVVGRGGNTTQPLTIAENGVSSSITIGGTTYTANGGGGGAGRDRTNYNSFRPTGGTGGSGGGGQAPDDDGSGRVGGVGGVSNKTSYTGWISYGNNGGSGTGLHYGGGGGGAGAIGGNGVVSTQGGSGGVGVNLGTIFGTNVGVSGWVGGGGGGVLYGSETSGTGGTGGGGTGGRWSPNVPDGVAGTANTGGGGGSSCLNTFYSYGTGGAGGSGVVVIIYKLIPSSSSIELLRGTASDSNIDYKIGNYGGEFKIISSVNNADTNYVRITSTGDIYNAISSPYWTYASDRRIKENIEKASYNKCYDNINNLELYRFNYINGFNNVNKDITQLGFIAQEVQDIFPKAVTSHSFNNKDVSIPDLLSIDITQINHSLYGAVKKLIELNEDKDLCIKRLIEMDDDKEKRIKKLELVLNTSNSLIL